MHIQTYTYIHIHIFLYAYNYLHKHSFLLIYKKKFRPSKKGLKKFQIPNLCFTYLLLHLQALLFLIGAQISLRHGWENIPKCSLPGA